MVMTEDESVCSRYLKHHGIAKGSPTLSLYCGKINCQQHRNIATPTKTATMNQKHAKPNERDMSRYERLIQSLKNENAKLQQSLATLKSSSDIHSKDMASKLAFQQQTQNQKHETEIKEMKIKYEAEIKTLKSDNAKLKKNYVNASSSPDVHNKERDVKSVSKNNDINKLKQRQDKPVDMKTRYEDTIQALEKENAKLQQSLEKVRLSSKTYHIELEEKEYEVNNLNQRLNKQHGALKFQYESMIKQLEIENEETVAQVKGFYKNKMETNLAVMYHEFDCLKQRQQCEVDDIVKQYDNEITTLKEKNAKLQQSLEHLHPSSDVYKTESKEKLLKQAREVDNLRQEHINEVNQLQARYEHKIKALESEHETKLRQSVTSKVTSSLDVYKKEYEAKLVTKQHEIENTKQRLQHEFEEMKTQHTNQILRLENENQKLKQTLEQRSMYSEHLDVKPMTELKSKLEKKENELLVLKKRVQHTQDELDEMKTRFENKINAMEKENAELRQSFGKDTLSSKVYQQEIEETLATKDREIDILRERLEKEIVEIESRHTNQILRLENENQKLKQTLEQRSMYSEHLDVKPMAELKSKLEKRENELLVLKKRIQHTQDELDEMKTRLSKAMSDKLTDNNPNIADLSDKNRPTKIQERYSELYDNQWTNAFETLTEKYNEDDEKTIKNLLRILINISQFCEDKAVEQMTKLQKCISMASSQDLKIPQNIIKNLKDCRKTSAEQSAKHVYQEFVANLPQSGNEVALHVLPFVKECLEICWLMMVQDPPVVLKKDEQPDAHFNTDMYKPYTKSGKKISFVVWPPLLLYKDGPILCKGIAQGSGVNPKGVTAVSVSLKDTHM